MVRSHFGSSCTAGHRTAWALRSILTGRGPRVQLCNVLRPPRHIALAMSMITATTPLQWGCSGRRLSASRISVKVYGDDSPTVGLQRPEAQYVSNKRGRCACGSCLVSEGLVGIWRLRVVLRLSVRVDLPWSAADFCLGFGMALVFLAGRASGVSTGVPRVRCWSPASRKPEPKAVGGELLV